MARMSGLSSAAHPCENKFEVGRGREGRKERRREGGKGEERDREEDRARETDSASSHLAYLSLAY